MVKKLAQNEQGEIGSKEIRAALSLIFRQVRQQNNLRQFEFAESLGITIGTANKLEMGKSRWNDELIPRVAKALGADLPTVFRALADILEGAEPTADPSPEDPLRTRLLDIYDRRNLGDMMQMLGTLAKTWHPDEI